MGNEPTKADADLGPHLTGMRIRPADPEVPRRSTYQKWPPTPPGAHPSLNDLRPRARSALCPCPAPAMQAFLSSCPLALVNWAGVTEMSQGAREGTQIGCRH